MSTQRFTIELTFPNDTPDVVAQKLVDEFYEQVEFRLEPFAEKLAKKYNIELCLEVN